MSIICSFAPCNMHQEKKAKCKTKKEHELKAKTQIKNYDNESLYCLKILQT